MILGPEEIAEEVLKSNRGTSLGDLAAAYLKLLGAAKAAYDSRIYGQTKEEEALYDVVFGPEESEPREDWKSHPDGGPA